MAKQIIGNGSNSYTFDASAKTVAFSGITLAPHQILLINNVSRETIIYNPFSSGKGFTGFSNGVLTLEYDTTSFADADVLQIFYDNSDEVEVRLADMSTDLKNLCSVIANPPWHDQRGGLIIGSGTIGTVSTITSVTTVSNISQLGGRLVQDVLTNPLIEVSYSLIRDRFS